MASPPVSRMESFAWLVPLGMVGLSRSLVAQLPDHWGSDRTVGVLMLGGLVGGLLWQVAYRRDLAERLTFLSACCALLAVPLSLLGGTVTGDSPEDVTSFIGVVAGLVLTERFLRRAEQRTMVRSGAA